MPLKITKARRERGLVRLAVEVDGKLYERDFAPPPDYAGTQADFARAARQELIAYVRDQRKVINSVRLDFEGEDIAD